MKALSVTLYRLDLSEPVETACLSPDENARAARLLVPDIRRRFIAAHVGLREVLARETGIAPEALVFTTGEHGKPALSGITDAPHFNLSHSDDLAVVAVARAPVGVDIERIRPLSAQAEMMAMAFSDEEIAVFETLEEYDRAGAFFRLWTCKEALVKADGQGFRLMKTFNLPFMRRPHTAATQNEWPQVNVGTFTVQNIHIADGFASAFALYNLHSQEIPVYLASR